MILSLPVECDSLVLTDRKSGWMVFDLGLYNPAGNRYVVTDQNLCIKFGSRFLIDAIDYAGVCLEGDLSDVT